MKWQDGTGQCVTRLGAGWEQARVLGLELRT
jgi:hypothetical protein